MKDLYNELRVEEDFTFIGILGQEGERRTMTINVPFHQVGKVFKAVPYKPDSQLLIQRETHQKRIKNINKYLDDPLACLPAGGSIVECMQIKKIIDNCCYVTIPKGSFRYMFDGQARTGAIDLTVTSNPKLKNNTFTIKLIESLGVIKDNQLFTDWNSAGTVPNQSICKAMDSRALINRFTRDVIQGSGMLSDFIDFTKASVSMSSKSSKLWTLNQFSTFITILTGTTAASAETNLSEPSKQEDLKGFIYKFLDVLGQHPQLKELFEKNKSATKGRAELVIGTAVWLKSVALFGKVVYLNMATSKNIKADWSILDGFNDIDFSRKNPEWKGRCLTYRDKFEDNAFNHKAVCSYLIQNTSLPLPTELETVEEEVMTVRSAGLKQLREEKKANNNGPDNG